jgi:hypothetical protein
VATARKLAERVYRLLKYGAEYVCQVIEAYEAAYRERHVSRARVTQIMNLRLLAADIQEALLFLPRTERGRDPIHLRQLQPLTRVADWKEQRALWQALLAKKRSAQGVS